MLVVGSRSLCVLCFFGLTLRPMTGWSGSLPVNLLAIQWIDTV